MFTNDDRVALVDDAINDFAKAAGLDTSLDADGPQTAAADMICDILHWVAANDPDGKAAAMIAVRCGIANYSTESYIDYSADWVDELGPEAHIEIYASCNGEVWQSVTGAAASLISTYPL